ncbi:MAG: peptidoglycan DD-metalloendopeptidase family protein [Candidatus Kerfeldbacteria bacterium]
MRYFVILIFSLLIPSAVFAGTADNFIYPLGVWQVSTHHGDEYGSYYHMGIDAGFELGSGAPVYAVADGVVREAEVRTQFGLVVLVEHTLPGGKRIVSLYGHLDPSDIPAPPGTQVTAGQRLGSLGDSTVNGGWSPHIHFGIHKSEYTGVWVYYGHVSDPATADDWYDPETYIPNHLNADSWNPDVSFDLDDGEILDDSLNIKAYVTDIGSGVDYVQLKISDDGQQTWKTLVEDSGTHDYPYYLYTSLSAVEDGDVYVRVNAKDEFGNVEMKTVKMVKKEDAYTTRHFASIKGKPSSGLVKTWFQAGNKDKKFYPYKKKWKNSGDVAVGDVTGNGVNNIITVKNGKNPIVNVFSRNGELQNSFKAFPYGKQKGARVATGDIDGDGVQEIIVGSGRGMKARVKVFDRFGVLMLTFDAFNGTHTGGLDVAAGDVDGDGLDEIVAGVAGSGKSKFGVFDETGAQLEVTRAFGKKYTGGINVAVGNIDKDEGAEIIVGTNGGKTGTVRVFEWEGELKKYDYEPFGDDFTGPVDVTCADWEGDGKDEILMSQAGDGEAWVKTYRYGPSRTVLATERVYKEGFEGGARIDGWR